MSSGLTAAEIRWPAVPACYGWLSLDRRGTWRLKGEPVRHAGMVAFINRNYGPHDDGSWVVRNGPQTVYVDLEYAPLVLRLESHQTLYTHTGGLAGEPTAVFVDDEGNVLVQVRAGIGLLDDRDLTAFLSNCTSTAGVDVTDDLIVAAALAKGDLVWSGLTIETIGRVEVPERFRFLPRPRANQIGGSDQETTQPSARRQAI